MSPEAISAFLNAAFMLGVVAGVFGLSAILGIANLLGLAFKWWASRRHIEGE